MGKFIIGTFGILGWAFYVLSGGATFEPETRMAAAADVPQPEVTRARTVDMAALTRPVAAKPQVADIAPTPTAEPVEVALQTAPVFAGDQVESIGITPTFASLSAPAPAAVGSPDLTMLREVAGRAVNMREGPSTSYDVIDTLPQGTQAEVVENDGAGWVRVRVVGTGQMGWMAERLLTNG